MTGLEKAREVSEKLKVGAREDKIETASSEPVREAEINSAMATIDANSELAGLYRDNAKVGSENLGGQSPLLKVFTAGRSDSTLQDGKEPTNGYFFYKPTQEQFEKVQCHILTISKGFRADGFQGKKNVFNQIMAGVIVNEGATKLFIMYVTGTKLNRMWDFGKEVNKYTHAKPLPIPMFALSVELSTVKESTKFGNVWVVDFKIKKNEGGMPLVITDPGKFVFLREMVTSAEGMVDSLVGAKTTEEVVETEIDAGNGPTDSAGNKIEDIILPDEE